MSLTQALFFLWPVENKASGSRLSLPDGDAPLLTCKEGLTSDLLRDLDDLPMEAMATSNKLKESPAQNELL